MKMRNDGREMKSIKTVFATVAAVITLIAAGAINQTAAQKVKIKSPLKGNEWAQQTGSTPQATTAFTAARDLIDDAQWARAEQAFNQYVTKFPKEENLDAAMYWTAYAEYQMKKFDVCKQTLDKMLKAYAKTSWKQDADLLLAQLPGAVSTNVIATSPIAAEVAAISSEAIATAVEAATAPVAVAQLPGRAVSISPDVQERIAESKARADARTQEAKERTAERVKEMQDRIKDKMVYQGIGEGIGIGMGRGPNGMMRERLADDDPCEFKIVVLQSLTESDPQRGVVAATDWLKPNSGQTPPCRRAALGVIARHGGKAGLPTLLSTAENDPDVNVRARAISYLGMTNDDSVIDSLLKFALNSTQNQITEAAMYALAQHTSPRAATALSEIALSATRPIAIRQKAISGISRRPGEPAVDALLNIYDKSTDIEIRKVVISGFGNRSKSERAGAKLLEIARSSDNIELRKAAISAIGRRGGEGAIDNLMNLYDHEANEEIKSQIINSFAYSNDQKVTHKLIEIARNPQTPMERRRRIVMILGGRSKDPEVIKYFEDLLRQ
jgi:HEAT repeat protein